MVESTRLCIKGSQGSSLVRAALFKAFHRYCLAQKVDFMMATGRRPVDRIYDSLLFTDVGEAGMFYPMTFTGGVPHRVMALSPSGAQTLYVGARHPHTDFFFETIHPDIDISGAKQIVDSLWMCPDHVPASPLQWSLPVTTAASSVAVN